MENFLKSKELWNLVEEGIPAPAVGIAAASEAQRKSVEEAKLKDLKVKNFLFQAIDREILETILDKSTSKAIWNSMLQKYQGSTKVKRAQLQALRKEFELLNMKAGETVDKFLGRTLTIVNKMNSNGEKMEQSTVVSKILRSLTPKFNYVVCSIEESNDLSTLSIDELHGSLLVHEQRMQGCQEEDHVLKISHDERSGRGRGRGSSRGGRGRGRDRQAFDKATIQCYNCHKFGHFQYECPDWEKKANYVEADDNEELLLMACTEPKKANEETIWYLDSGCSNHMTGNKHWFFQLNEDFRHSVKMGTDLKILVKGKGNIRIEVEGITQVISEVYYVPELKNNLLSCGQIQEKGLAVLMQNNECKVFHSQEGLIMHALMATNSWFKLLASVILPKVSSETCFNMSTNDITELWHKRVCRDFVNSKNPTRENLSRSYFTAADSIQPFHPPPLLPPATSLALHLLLVRQNSQSTAASCCRLGFSLRLATAEKKEGPPPSVVLFILFRGGVCGGAYGGRHHYYFSASTFGTSCSCVRGKQHREIIPKESKWRATKQLQLIHLDICGPITPLSESNKSYMQQVIEESESEGHESEQPNEEEGNATGNTSSNTSGGTTTATNPARRVTRTPNYLQDYTNGEGLSEEEEEETQVQHIVMFMISDDPIYYDEAVKSKRWREAMDTEIGAILKNKTWELVDAPDGVKVIGVKWVYRTKLNENGKIDKSKARLVAKGYA
ncbi:hypothetical protein LXL04_032767 [Taraxacum kok-saghyz]